MHILTTYILPFLGVLGLLIIIHELGHFLAAKLSGIRVERFSVGFPPRLIGKKIGDTDYCISALPFGGYVKMSGMIDESMDEASIKGEPWEFMSKPVWVRMMVLFAGPLANILLALFIFTASVFYTGVAEPTGTTIGRVMENMPAQQIGLQAGDEIYRVDDRDISKWEELTAIIHSSAGKKLTIFWRRDGQNMSAEVIPQLDKVMNYGLIGIEPKTVLVRPGILQGMALGFKSSWNLTRLMIKSFGKLFSGEVSLQEGLAGPLRIAQMTGDSAKSGFGSLLIFAALLSLNLGILNLLPIPVLDGGHLLLLTIEGIIRRPISTKVKMAVQQVGMALLLALMLFVLFNDFRNIF